MCLDAGSTDSGSAEADAFWAELGGTAVQVQSAEAGGSDEEPPRAETRLLRVAVGGALQEVAVGAALVQAQLDTTGVFVVDSGSEVFVWIGKGASKEERAAGMGEAQAYITAQHRPAWTPITRLIETGETPIFKSIFTAGWTVAEKPLSKFASKPAASSSAAAPAAAAKVDVSALHRSKSVVAAQDGPMVDDGSGLVELWRIQNFEKVAVPVEQHGQFYSGDSYILLYTYTKRNKKSYIIYFWQGVHSSADERGASALLARDLDDSLHGEPQQVRVVQGKEPAHFLTLFKGRMVVHRGGFDSGFNATRSGGAGASAAAPSPVALYHVRGTTALNTRALQVDECAASLNTADCFVVNDTGAAPQQYVWLGAHANADEKALARTVAASLLAANPALGGASVEVAEGEEPEAFWTALGGKGAYTSEVQLAEDGDVVEPALFHCSNASGAFRVEQVHNFAQDDLIGDDVMLLDLYHSVYVWVGKESNRAERDQGQQAALDYVAHAPDGRDRNTPIYRVEEGDEPPAFAAAFPGWTEKTDFSDPYQERLRQLAAAKAAAVAAGGDASAVAAAVAAVAAVSPAAAAPKVVRQISAADVGFAAGGAVTLTLAQLTDKSAALPDNVDLTKKEQYLSDAEFAAVFKCSKADFAKLAGWKQTEQKKKANLF